ncbi:protein spire isoform X1 [Diorhabda carinulata]|uniref:protein spire isoform X1 n=1 Tax=Diorhabda carinulata TaxID=1163345 RepID=UPI0025A192B0|nr:protein spire isoform X1 [Diorhabda carinulata]
MNSRTKCKINSDGSVCLSTILNSFNSSIKEEHAWALCYQIAKYFEECLQAHKQNSYIITEVQHVYLKTDGTVHENTGIVSDTSRRLPQNEIDIIKGIGVVIYAALDSEIQNGEEKVISYDLEQLISDLIADDWNNTDHNHHETDDEGIERDSDEDPNTSRIVDHITLKEVIRRCESHLGYLTKAQAEAHYKAVVRALVAEAIELSTFLEKVAQGSISLPSSSTSDQLEFSDWAKFWVQVMNELRTGVKLKKVNFTKAPIEYELTPYEVLMKDIRSCKYNLRKIMINGDVPCRITKDAHAIILEFIRSRPPLKKVSDRKIVPQPRALTPREQLLNSIRKGRKLRPVPTPRKFCFSTSKFKLDVSNASTSAEVMTPPKPAVRKLIKVDFSQFEDDDDDDIADTPDSATEPGLWSSEYPEISDTSLVDVYDLATQAYARNPPRRNTLEVVDTNNGCYSVPQSRPCSRQSCNSSETESVQLEPEVARQIQDELTCSQTWQDTISLDDRLSLTLAEIVHIRTVLTKAELDALPVEGKVRHDVEARKVCFLCLKTRFGIFGPWGQRCTLCKRTVCTKCSCKMNIPMEHFSSVPVVLLSPSIMCSPEDDNQSIAKSLVNKLSDTSPSSRDVSPAGSRPGSSMETTESGGLGKFRTRAAVVGRINRASERFKHSQMMVCQDCKTMVLQIIKSARANRSAIRNKTIQSLTLNLSPVF